MEEKKKPVDKQVDKPADKPVEKKTDKKTDKVVEKKVEKKAEKKVNEKAEQKVSEPTFKKVDKQTDKTVKKQIDTKTNKKGNKKKSKKTIVIVSIIIAIVVVAIIAGIGYVGYHAMQLAKLNQESSNVLQTKFVSATGKINKDATIDMDIKTSGQYAIVEETIKTHMNDLLTAVKNINEVYDAEALQGLLEAENISNDGPEFVATKQTIEEKRKEANEYLDKHIALSNHESMLNLIDEKDVSDYYKQLYKEQVSNSEELKTMLSKIEKELTTAKEVVTDTFDYASNIINFLAENKDDWEVRGNRIMFSNITKLNEYNRLVRNVTRAY